MSYLRLNCMELHKINVQDTNYKKVHSFSLYANNLLVNIAMFFSRDYSRQRYINT